MDDIKVSILCNVYNHEHFIAKAIESFLMQKTDFAFEILIHDDASTDNSANIIRKYAEKYPDVIIPIFQKENQYSKRNGMIGRIQLGRARGKYIAICEGDDYWIDNNKLQCQVDYLESHNECALCCHSGIYVDSEGNKLPGLFRVFTKDGIITTEDVISNWICPTASIVYRKSVELSSDFPEMNNAPCGDYPLTVNMALHGTIYYIDKPMSAYRKNDNSVSSSWSKRKDIRYEVNVRFIDMIDKMDEYSNYQYHNQFNVMRSSRVLMNLLIKRKYREALKKEYKLVRKLKRKECIYFVASDRTPWLINIYGKIRDSHRKAQRSKK